MNNKEFYIGWKNELPAGSKQAIKKLLIAVFILLPPIVIGIIYFTKPFNNHIFEYGNVREFTGIYYAKPFPVLVLDKGQAPESTNNYALLIGYGKHGAETFLSLVENKKSSLNGTRIKIWGTMIYGDDKLLLELSRKEKSVIAVSDSNEKQETKEFGNTTLKGEIIDPKCYFGVMKPGEGKVHKSCAIRCISGGIPPVFKVKNEKSNSYYIIKGINGEAINKEILSHVGENVTISGEIIHTNGWDVIKTEPNLIVK